ncbi:hypothetical protein SAMN02745148_01057 [Modicisalibacter ilicicola DSM 19980]|uniref:Uncharacterized protein n=1 Tax=Modicisalibacter ilicicola DSM 19980 TaxID=1121942 RepID=A0A1M4W382_9GAMM|nr:hypothetical protein [Halomonas ilicicola]SHE75615.1 hypothetical protein SAMN02745148_01057 [Halomonas ilicicola DSM 19980]
MSPSFYLAVGFCASLILAVGGYTGVQLIRLKHQQQQVHKRDL